MFVLGRVALTLALVAVMLGSLAANHAQAATHAFGLPGGVFVWADDAKHDFRFLKSDRDVLPRTQGRADSEDYAADSRVASIGYGSLASGSKARMGERYLRLTERVGVEITQLQKYMETLPDLPSSAEELVSELYAEIDQTHNVLKGYAQSARGYYRAAGKLANTLFDPELDAGKVDDLYRYLEESFDDLRDLEVILEEHVQGIKVAREAVEASSDVPPAVKEKMVNFALKAARLTTYYGDSGFVTIGFLKALGAVGVVADIGYTFYTGLSQNRVLIQDRTNNPIVAEGLCSPQVRSLQGGTLGATVSCPAMRFPFAAATATFSLLSSVVIGFVEAMGLLPATGLYVFSGTADDDISVELPADQSLFRKIVVSGGGGKDTIRGSDYGERLVGGDGNDTIYGKGGNDEINGGTWLLAPAGNPANDNDRLFGGADSDSVDGEDGDDLILGGPGDDWRHLGSAALFGGDGNDAIIGGPGRDSMDGAEGRDSVFAKESEFQKSLSNPNSKQIDYVDYYVDCGDTESEQYVSVGAGEQAYGCSKNPNLPPFATPSLATIVGAHPSGGWWPWFR